ncbi:MAG: CDGSH iron-sulfur domain-containing protein [Betaproteobacteria bacterium]|nr:CDGSH iron-sulfur domain-containing protein [Betaproteobacteria bacterium]
MTQAVCTQKAPYAIDLQPGEYYWCACGKSKTQPFCDGAHSDTDLSPIAFTVKEAGTQYLCGCRSTSNAPFCDGSHKAL